ncbi:MAG TPA: hypothetical protein VM076_00985 [Gemmatimonadaceae bacterium]|nr:hypothetical protein [Gemmatimonadaceae bacterium]
MSRLALAVLALPALALLPRAPLPAQTPGAPSGAAVAVARLPAGATVRAALAGARFTGRVRTSRADTLVLALRDGAAKSLPFAGVDTIWQAGRATGRGAAIGAIAGGVVLAALGVAIAQGLCEYGGCGDDTRKAALGGGALGVAGGAVLGAGIGSLKRTWRRVYP